MPQQNQPLLPLMAAHAHEIYQPFILTAGLLGSVSVWSVVAISSKVSDGEILVGATASKAHSAARINS